MSAARRDRTQEFEAAGLLDGLEGGAREALAEGRLPLLPLITPLMEHTLRLHLRDQIRSRVFGAEDASLAGR